MVRCGLRSRFVATVLLSAPTGNRRELRQKFRSRFQIELHFDLVSDLETSEHEARWLNPEVGHQNLLLGLRGSLPVTQSLRVDLHGDDFLLAGYRQGASRLGDEGGW